jgi:hypothetical protein
MANGPDFSTVDTRDKAMEMSRLGKLEKLFLFPKEFGGRDIPENTLYVPIGFVVIKSDIERNIIAPLVQAGKITRYVARAEYQGTSGIPIAIEIATEPGKFRATIKIWGKALESEPE